MRALIQRVTQASVTVDSQTISSIGHGLVVLLGVGHNDGEEQARWMAEKIATLRIFSDTEGKMNLSVLDVKGGAIVVSQFTLFADAQKGRRPSYIDAARPEVAAPLVERVAQFLREQGVPTQTGRFGAEMLVGIHNDGPVTIWLEK
ncbi:MAG: D-aminoacyl-tRNA deacylase [Anaerolineales bacterium]|nr:D-aminoacyl-tRNA deacylase [Anaerolineales bacterium]